MAGIALIVVGVGLMLLHTWLRIQLESADDRVSLLASGVALAGLGGSLIVGSRLSRDPDKRPDTLQFLTAFAAAAPGSRHVETVRSLRDGESSIDGLTIDTDLSWALLLSLTASGVADAEDIATAARADSTARGQELAAQATASQPSMQAKWAAWDAMTTDRGLSNALLRSTALGFGNPATAEFLADFVQPYFGVILRLWETRGGQIAQDLIRSLYPAALTSPSLREAGNSWLASNPMASPALRRLVQENLAETERALAAQALSSRRRLHP